MLYRPLLAGMIAGMMRKISFLLTKTLVISHMDATLDPFNLQRRLVHAEGLHISNNILQLLYTDTCAGAKQMCKSLKVPRYM